MRPNEFKLRQRENQANPIPMEYRAKVRLLINQGKGKKLLCVVFGCSYAHLKECH